jgi:hypothetical protein
MASSETDENVLAFPRPVEPAAVQQRSQAMHEPNRMKLAIFAANADGGLTLTRAGALASGMGRHRGRWNK